MGRPPPASAWQAGGCVGRPLPDELDCSTPGFPVLHYLLEFAQTHVRCFDDAFQPSHPLSLLLLVPSIFPSIRVLSNEVALLHHVAKVQEFQL